MTEYMRTVLAWMPQGTDWIIILLIALLLFGRRLPEILPKIARSIGKSLTEFKRGLHEVKETKDEIEEDINKIKGDVEKEVKDTSGNNKAEKAD
jgi:sec-independent protein translocase protein TatA